MSQSSSPLLRNCATKINGTCDQPTATNIGSRKFSNNNRAQYQSLALMDSVLEQPNSNQHPNKKYNPTNNYGRTPSISLLPYYLPCFTWIPQYTWSKFFSDLLAGISLASFQIPLALSYATSIAHVEPLSGLYSLAITPFIYAIFGSVPQMIVGPESAISIVVGQAVENLTSHDDTISIMSISVIITFISGLVLLIFGILRLGFLGNVLSRPLLRGFISSIGLVMVVDSLITELKLNSVLANSEKHYHTAFGKLQFLLKYSSSHYHKPTTILSGSCFTVLFVFRYIKKKYMSKHRWLVFFPEILIVIFVTISLSAKMRFKHSYGIAIVGDFNTRGMDKLKNPLSKTNRELIPELLNTGFLTAILGFFESTTASKTLGSTYDLAVSSNRELVALGSMNIFASLFGALPAFGGYGRSKINAFSGAQTVMSGALMGAITLVTIKLLLSFIHYIPVCVLSVITTIVGLSLLEEAPSEVKFHIRCKGYDELTVFFITVLTTLFYSVEMSICIGCGYSIITIIRHSAKSRIQILGRIEGTKKFTNMDGYMESNDINQTQLQPTLEEIEGCLIVKIPEPLTFTNSEDLRERLHRLEQFGSVNAHPGGPGIQPYHSTQYIIFDLHGMTFMDSSAAHILFEIISGYNRRNIDVLLCRVPFNNQIRDRLNDSGVVSLILKPSNDGTISSLNNPMSSLDNSISNNTSPYFLTVDESLTFIEYIENRNTNFEPVSLSDSFLSTTLVNANIV